MTWPSVVGVDVGDEFGDFSAGLDHAGPAQEQRDADGFLEHVRADRKSVV